ncbi:MAG: prepilin-type N-terminal cleavage/methylation domain-containing protein [Sedimentisphaerales bacterium]|nr:prepilin-type N-terminal cleavage/methylation domain-containing protein [Sedimentisphaerales bacterium]
MNSRFGQKGFSLLELLTAMAMMVVLAGSLYSALYIGFKSKQSAQAAVGPVRRGQIVMKLLQRDLEATPPPTGILAGVFQGIDAVDSRGRPSDTLLFYTCHNSSYIPGATGDIVEVELLLTAAPDNQTSYLVRRTTVNLLPSATPTSYEEILCRDVVSLNLCYYDGYDWLDIWDSSSLDNTLPQAVEIVLALRLPETDDYDEMRGYQVTHIFTLPCSLSNAALEGESGSAGGGMGAGQN